MMMVFPVPVGAEKETACGFSIEAVDRANVNIERSSAKASS